MQFKLRSDDIEDIKDIPSKPLIKGRINSLEAYEIIYATKITIV